MLELCGSDVHLRFMALVVFIPVMVVSTVAGLWGVFVGCDRAFAATGFGLAALAPPGVHLLASFVAWQRSGKLTKSGFHSLALLMCLPPLLLGSWAIYRAWHNREATNR